MHVQVRQNIHLVSLLSFISQTNFHFKVQCVRFWPCLVCETATPIFSSQPAHVTLIYTEITSTHPTALSQIWHTLLSLSCRISARPSVFQESVSTHTFKRNRVFHSELLLNYSCVKLTFPLSTHYPPHITYHPASSAGFPPRSSTHSHHWHLNHSTPPFICSMRHVMELWHRIHTFRLSCFPVLHPEDHIIQFMTSLDPGQWPLTLIFRPTTPSVQRAQSVPAMLTPGKWVKQCYHGLVLCSDTIYIIDSYAFVFVWCDGWMPNKQLLIS